MNPVTPAGRSTLHPATVRPRVLNVFSTVLRRVAGPCLLVCAGYAGAAGGASGATRATSPASAPSSVAEILTQVTRALDAGDIPRADSLFTLPSPPSPERHRFAIATARLAASRGDWRTVDRTLRAWQHDPGRREGSGEVLFWRGWSAMHQGRTAEADSLLMLASAYGGEPRSQDALEYRLAGLLETGDALQSYLRGLPESPLPHPLRLASLNRVPPPSALHPQARWHLVLLHEVHGDTALSRPLLDTLASDLRSVHGRRAAAYRALLKERASPDTALTAYETLLIRHQQGMTAEMARQRVRILREKHGLVPK